LNTVAFQCSRKQKCQNYGVQNNYIDSNVKIKGSTVTIGHIGCTYFNVHWFLVTNAQHCHDYKPGTAAAAPCVGSGKPMFYH